MVWYIQLGGKLETFKKVTGIILMVIGAITVVTVIAVLIILNFLGGIH